MKQTKLQRLVTFVAIAFVVGLVACDGGPSGPAMGRMSLYLTDAPGDVRAAVVTIEQIYLQGHGEVDDDSLDDDTLDVPDSLENDSLDENDDHDEAEDGGRLVLRSTPITVDLLTLRDSLMLLIDSTLIPAGTYGQLRFVISGGYIEVEGADSAHTLIYATSPDYPGLPAGAHVAGVLQMPSYAHSGLKVKLPAGAIHVDANGVTTISVDFDVAHSFGRLSGNSGRWVMSPVIKATELPDDEQH